MPDFLARLKSKFDSTNFRLRVLSMVIGAPLALGCVYVGGWIYSLVVMLFMAVALHEWVRVVSPAASWRVKVAAQAALAITFGVGFVVSFLVGMNVLCFIGCDREALAVQKAVCVFIELVSLAIVYGVAWLDDKKSARWVVLGIPYIGFGGFALLYMRFFFGLAPTVYLFLTVWGTDIGAYLAGLTIGGPKLAPKVSPKKTWAGLIGGMAFAAFFGYLVASGFGYSEQARMAAKLSLVLAVVAQAGDLFESYLKRRSGVKESGGLIPGHGGVLDRIDGLLFAAVFFVLTMLATNNGQAWL